MKKLLFLFSMVFLCAFVFGQPAIGTDARFNQVLQQPYAMILLPYSPEVVLAAMKNYRNEEPSSKERKANPKIYQSFQETSLIRYNPNADLTFEIGLKNPNNKNISVLYLLLNSPTEENNYFGNQVHFDVEQAKAYLDNLAIAILTYAVNKQIELQTSELGKANKRQFDLVNHGSELANSKAALLLNPLTNNERNINRIAALDRQISENQSAQAIQALEIEKQKSDLKALMTDGKANPDNV